MGLRSALRPVRRDVLSFTTAYLPAVLAAGGVAVVGLAGPGGLPWAGVLGVAALAAVVQPKLVALRRPGRSKLLAVYVSTRLLLVVLLALAYAEQRPADRAFAWWAALLLILGIVMESPLNKIVSARRELVVGLPGVPPVPGLPFGSGWLVVGSLGATLLGGVLAAVGAHPLWWLLVVVPLGPAYLVTLGAALRIRAVSARATSRIRPALEALRPEFAVYYAAVSGAEYQLGMWLPYLERLERPFIVITREPKTVATIARLTSAPVLVPMDLRAGSLDRMVVPSLKAAFYVQGSPANQTFQRYRQLTHIWLNHGDSDKQANFHPRHATYDRLFVCGQLGVDRYAAHGIDVAEHKFVRVGRPQIERIAYVDDPVPAEPTVLYAPTWQGGRPSTSYASLPVGPEIVSALLARGATVVFRPHPLSYGVAADAVKLREVQQLLAADAATSGRQHVWGEQAEREWDVADCFNASDALVTDVSSLASEYLASGKPLAMVAVTASGEAFRAEFPTAQVAYVIEKDLSTLDAALDDLLGHDPLREAREARRRYVLGEPFGPQAAEPFLAAAREVLDG